MQLFRVSTEQAKTALLDNRIVFISGGQKLSGTFSLDSDQFLCEHENRFFVSGISTDKEYGIYVDSGKLAIQLKDLNAIYLIKRDFDAWPEPPPTVSSK